MARAEVALLVGLLVLLVCGITTRVTSATAAPITGYVIPHSHDDVGWLLTISDYYNVYVYNIYNQIIEALTENPARKFIAVEQAYFTRWWGDASEQQKARTHQLVKNGQLEFIIGGWTMEDEACTTYDANINQMTLGHKFIKETFGVVPRFGWQIDPFGASTVAHEQFALMGFDATVIDRIPYKLKQQWREERNLEFVWQPSASYGSNLSIFTHVMYDMYCFPIDGIDWEWGSMPVEFLNIKSISDSVVNEIKNRNKSYRTNNVLFPFGCDFAHWWSTWMFYNMDQIMNYINNNSATYGVQVKYATLGEYFDAVHSANLTWPVRGPEDFFPYNDGDDQYWSGYYTSRNAVKGWVRSRENVLRTAEALHALSMPPWGPRSASSASGDLPRLYALRAANGEATHHDAVSGTSEPWVVSMYANHEWSGTREVEPVITQSLTALAKVPSLSLDVRVVQQMLSQGKEVVMVIYNPVAWQMQTFVEVPLFSNQVKVVSSVTGKTVMFDVLPAKNTCTWCPCQVAGTCGYPQIFSPYTLHFAVDLPPLGYATYVLTNTSTSPTLSSASPSYKTKTKTSESHLPQSVPNVGEPRQAAVVSLENSILKVDFDASTGTLRQISNKKSALRIDISQSFVQYFSTYPTNLGDSSSFDALGSTNKTNKKPGVATVANGAYGGAYVFHPRGNATVLASEPKSWNLVKGQYVTELRQEFIAPCYSSLFQEESCGVAQVFRLYNAGGNEDVESFLEILTDVGPLALNVNFVSRFNTSINNNRTLYTDDNCWEMQKRHYVPKGEGVNQRSDPIGGNYYPATCMTFTRDLGQNMQLTLLHDRTRGTSSQTNGALEVMYHRRIISTDFKGPLDLDDTDHLENLQTLLLFGDISTSTRLRHKLQYFQNFRPAITFSHAASSSSSSVALARTSTAAWSPLSSSLPLNVHLVSLVQFNDTINGQNQPNTLLLRLGHIFEKGEDPVLSQPVTLDLSKYFTFGSIVSIDERALSPVLPISAMNDRWNWKWKGNKESQTDNRNSATDPLAKKHAKDDLSLRMDTAATSVKNVTLNPMEIRTFFVTFK
jgi:hypothetical protein